MRGMKTSSSKKHPKGLSTDAKFWFYLVPFLSASIVVWVYGISWVLKEAPTAIPKFVASWQSGVQSVGYSKPPRAEVSAASLDDDSGVAKEKEPLVEVGQEGGLPNVPRGSGA